MKIKFEQTNYNTVEMTLNQEELETILDNIGEDQIEYIGIMIKKPGTNNDEED